MALRRGSPWRHCRILVPRQNAAILVTAPVRRQSAAAEIRGHLGDLQLSCPEPRDPSARRCDDALKGPHVDGDSKATLMAAHCRLDAHCCALLVGVAAHCCAWMRTAACAARLVGESSWQKRLVRPWAQAVPQFLSHLPTGTALLSRRWVSSKAMVS